MGSRCEDCLISCLLAEQQCVNPIIAPCFLAEFIKILILNMMPFVDHIASPPKGFDIPVYRGSEPVTDLYLWLIDLAV
jgi:hypothetical protein